MTRRLVLIYLSLFLLSLAFLTMALYARANCIPNDAGTAGNDIIDCTLTNQPGVTSDVEGLDGDDTITIDNGVNAPSSVYGDSAFAPTVTGNDIIVNNGNVSNSIVGDAGNGGATSGNDVIVNNGSASSIVGDNLNGPINNGNDSITNNGTVNGSISGDTSFGPSGTGNDNITNNGQVQGDVYGDGNVAAVGGGSDTINNAGIINGGIYGDSGSGGGGSDTIDNSGQVGYIIDAGDGDDNVTNSGYVGNDILAGAGDDMVTITGNATVGGIIDGGAGFDTLSFNLATTDPEELQAFAQQLAAQNPAGGTITIHGIVYTWQNFEQLSGLLLSLVRLNGVSDPLALFCALGGGIDVYAIVGNQGVLSISLSAQALSNATAHAQEIGANVTIAHSSSATVYALPSGDIQVNSPSGFDFSFTYQTRCGALPDPGPDVVETVEPDSFVIINRPR